MGRLQEKVCVLVCWALMIIYNAAEQEYVIPESNLDWNDARNHCQVCFKDLVTLTHNNIETVVKMLSSEHWIGLRKNFNSTSSSNMSWSSWSNGDPLTFQNWYPGWPLFNSSVPPIECCSCSCTCPATTTPTMSSFTFDPNVTDFTGFADSMNTSDYYGNITGTVPPTEATCTRSPMPTPAVSETEETYIEDSCVAMLSFGPWVERSCSERLPFICYEEYFPGKVNVTSVTSESANLTWLQAPGNISHYRVVANREVIDNVTDQTYNLVNLTAGARYVVHVFPVKCDRDLNSPNVTFYTKPNKVKNLTVTMVTETSIQVNWRRPAGNLDFYLLSVTGRSFQVTTESGQVDKLTPGGCYTFTVVSGVKDNSMWSEESHITAYTKPGKVSNLVASNNTENSLLLSWDPPKGNFTGFLVKAMNSSAHTLYDENVSNSQFEVPVTRLPIGTRITLSVIAVANGSLEGENTTIFSYTAPGRVSNLTVITESRSLTATWSPPEGNCSSFTVKLLLDGEMIQNETNLTETWKKFDHLTTATEYTVVVHAVSGQLYSPQVNHTNFTLPSPPTNAIFTSVNKNTITYKWSAPDNITKGLYLVNISSRFWGHSQSANVSDITSYTFSDLKSGTRYCFEVSIMAGGVKSSPAKNCNVKTVTEERQITLSMMCSSAKPLRCDETDTRASVLEQLDRHFHHELEDDIDWDLE